jgi:hypothetical protein
MRDEILSLDHHVNVDLTPKSPGQLDRVRMDGEKPSNRLFVLLPVGLVRNVARQGNPTRRRTATVESPAFIACISMSMAVSSFSLYNLKIEYTIHPFVTSARPERTSMRSLAETASALIGWSWFGAEL